MKVFKSTLEAKEDFESFVFRVNNKLGYELLDPESFKSILLYGKHRTGEFGWELTYGCITIYKFKSGYTTHQAYMTNPTKWLSIYTLEEAMFKTLKSYSVYYFRNSSEMKQVILELYTIFCLGRV